MIGFFITRRLFTWAKNGEKSIITKDESHWGSPGQSLKSSDNKGQFSVGMMIPGDYDFGTIDTPKEITIVYGQVVINGKKYLKGDSVTLVKGQPNVWEVRDFPVAYLCCWKK